MGISRIRKPDGEVLMRAVFLDRDGVLNRAIVRDGKPFPPATVEDLEINPEAPESLEALKNAGFFLVVVTNQPDVARGTQSREIVECMHEKLRRVLPIDAFFACYHDGAETCDCRKPKPGMLLRAAREYALILNESFMIGDRWRDIDAGHAAGVRTVLIDYGYRERGPENPPGARVASLTEAVNWILYVAAKQ